MKDVTENTIDYRQGKYTRKHEICPDLVLAETVVCDAIGQPYRPSNRQMREFCMNECYAGCSLRRSA
jgi:hypothetical protein